MAEVAEYAAWCAERDFSFELDWTWGQMAENLSEEIDAYENKSAPEELKAFTTPRLHSKGQP